VHIQVAHIQCNRKNFDNTTMSILDLLEGCSLECSSLFSVCYFLLLFLIAIVPQVIFTASIQILILVKQSPDPHLSNPNSPNPL